MPEIKASYGYTRNGMTRTKPKVGYKGFRTMPPIKRLRMIDELIKCLEMDYERIRHEFIVKEQE